MVVSRIFALGLRWGTKMPGSSAVGGRSFRANSDLGIEARVTRVEGRMDALETSVAGLRSEVQKNRAASAAENKATHELLEKVLEGVGKPANGPASPPSGLYWVVEQVSTRVKPFEKRWDMVKGAAGALSVALPPIGALIWFLSGSKLTALFH